MELIERAREWINNAALGRLASWIMTMTGYVMAYDWVASLSVTEWLPSAGLRFVVLLCCSPFYWSALWLGDTLIDLKLAFDCHATFGLGWSVITAISPLLWIMPVTYVMRHHALIGLGSLREILGVMTGSVAVALILMCRSELLLYVSTMSRAGVYTSVPLSKGFCAYFMGDLVGILTVVPAALTLVHKSLHQIFGMARKIAVWTIPVFALLVILDRITYGDGREIVWGLTVIPVAVLAFRHRVTGAAWGGAGASAIIGLTYPCDFDQGLIHVDILLAFAMISTVVLTGSPAIAHRPHPNKSILCAEMAVTEARLHKFSLQLEFWYRRLHREIETMGARHPEFSAKAAFSEKRLERTIVNISPVQREGLMHALADGPILELSKVLCVDYRAFLGSMAVGRMACAHQSMLYRIICDGAEILLRRRFVHRLALGLRSCRKGTAIRISTSQFGDLRCAEAVRRAIVSTFHLGDVRYSTSLQMLTDRVLFQGGRLQDRGHAIFIFLPHD